MQNNTISTSIQLNIGDKTYMHAFNTDSREQLYHALWDYMTRVKTCQTLQITVIQILASILETPDSLQHI